MLYITFNWPSIPFITTSCATSIPLEISITKHKQNFGTYPPQYYTGIAFFDTYGVVHKKLVPPRQTVNEILYGSASKVASLPGANKQLDYAPGQCAGSHILKSDSIPGKIHPHKTAPIHHTISDCWTLFERAIVLTMWRACRKT